MTLDDEQRAILAFIARGGYDDLAQICQRYLGEGTTMIRKFTIGDTVTMPYDDFDEVVIGRIVEFVDDPGPRYYLKDVGPYYLVDIDHKYGGQLVYAEPELRIAKLRIANNPTQMAFDF